MTAEEEKFIQSTTLYVKGISKTFGNNKALDDVNLFIMPGEIMGLLGKNGCGKSTLIKILSGYYHPDEGGMLFINGQQVRLPLLPGEFKRYGMSFVHQDLGLVDSLTVVENWILEDIATRSRVHIHWKEAKERAAAVFKKYGVDILPDAPVASLGPVQKAMLAILRGVEDLGQDTGGTGRRGLLVLDEPTVFLPKAEVDTLFRLVRSLSYEGISVMFVSHDLDEIISLTDSFTVLRDGRNVGNGNSHMIDKQAMIEMILGQSLEEYHVQIAQEEENTVHPAMLQAQDLCGSIARHVSFAAYPGEVVGITGLVGSGFEEIPYLLFGTVEGQTGTLRFNGISYNLAHFSPERAVEAQMALIPADRKNMGGVLSLQVFENMMMQSMKHYSPFKLQKRKMKEKAAQLIADYKVHPKDINLDFGQLSGGNQQKVLLAKWIQEDPKLLILHEPTQGIDVGARQAIYSLIEDVVRQTGMTVICSSSDYEQLEQICNRVLIMVGGKVVDQITGRDITKSRITSMCYAK